MAEDADEAAKRYGDWLEHHQSASISFTQETAEGEPGLNPLQQEPAQDEAEAIDRYYQWTQSVQDAFTADAEHNGPTENQS